jgi:hypothetical protein
MWKRYRYDVSQSTPGVNSDTKQDIQKEFVSTRLPTILKCVDMVKIIVEGKEESLI